MLFYLKNKNSLALGKLFPYWCMCYVLIYKYFSIDLYWIEERIKTSIFFFENSYKIVQSD
jgi:hypothetical protein